MDGIYSTNPFPMMSKPPSNAFTIRAIWRQQVQWDVSLCGKLQRRLSRFSIQIWAVGIAVLYGMWAYWYLRVYGYSDFLFEVGDYGSSRARQMVGSPRFMDVPNWVFNNPVLFLVGLAITLTGFTLSVVHWRLSFLSFAGYGIIYLFFVWVSTGSIS